MPYTGALAGAALKPLRMPRNPQIPCGIRALVRWPPPTPSSSLLIIGSLVLAISSQAGLRPEGLAIACAAAAATLASYGRLYLSTSSRRPRPDVAALSLALSPYAAALALEGPRLLVWYAAPVAAFSLYMALSALGRGRSPAALAAGSASLSLLSLAFSGVLGSPLPRSIPESAAWASLATSEVLLVECRLGRAPRFLPFALLSAGLASSIAVHPLAVAFVDPLYLALRYSGRPADAGSLRAFGRRLALSSALSLALLAASPPLLGLLR